MTLTSNDKPRRASKVLSSVSDLAINGAQPAFSEELHVGRPNIGNEEAFLELTRELLERRWLTNNGPLVIDFEKRVAKYLGVKNCVAMCNGTIALEIAIRALDMTGEVIVPSYTFIATAHALHWQGATPVFADIDSETHNLDPEAVRRLITPRTTGIIGVHLWGRAAPASELQAVADEHDLPLMFDAAHAFGCSYKGKLIGGLGSAEVFSFHATKFFNTFEGGAVTTNDDGLAEKMRLIRNFGFVGLDRVIHPGTNGKMVEICAAMGLSNMDCVDSIVETNRANYFAYREALSDIPGIGLLEFDETESNNYQYVVIELFEDCGISRDGLVDVLHAENVLARKYFWPGCHRMQPYIELYPDSGARLPNTEEVSNRVIVLPTGTAVEESDINVIAEIIRMATTAA